MIASSGSENVSDALTSMPKLCTLLKQINERVPDGRLNKAVVFCTSRKTTEFVYQILQNTMPHLNPFLLIGHNTTESKTPQVEAVDGMDEAKQRSILSKFKEMPDKRMLVTTNVAQEGMDASVDTVFVYEPLLDIRSYVQVRESFKILMFRVVAELGTRAVSSLSSHVPSLAVMLAVLICQRRS